MFAVPTIEDLLEQYPAVCSAEQAAEIMNMTPRVLADLTRARGIGAVKTGRSWSYPKISIIEWLNANTIVVAKAQAPALTPLEELAAAARTATPKPPLQEELDSAWGRRRRGQRRTTALAS